MNIAKLLSIFVVCVVSAANYGSVLADSYPAKPIRMVVPFPPGGATDVVARMVARRLQTAWGQPVIVDNRAGAAGNIGSQIVARAAPDGYTLLAVAAGLMTVNEFVYPNRGFSAINDFAPISNVTDAPHILVVHPSTPANTVQELLQLARDKPGKVTFGNAGIGAASHLTAEYLGLSAKVKFLHVPYKGSAPATTDLLGGQLNAMTDNMVALIPHIKTGKLKALAIASPRRFPLLPDVPTLSESGLPGFESGTWLGIVAPAGTPMEIRRRIQGEIATLLRSPDVRKDLVEQGLVPVANSPEEFAAYIRAEREKAGRIVEAAKIPQQ